MSWVKMDDRWPSSKKLRRVEPLDRLLWVMSIAYCSEQNTDGRLDGPMLELIAFLAGVTMPYESAGRLVDAKLFELDAGGWIVHDYLGFQPSAAQRNHISEARAEAGKRGGTRSGEGRKKPQGTTQANAKQVASAGLPTFGTPSSPVQSSPVLTGSSLLRESVVSQGSAEGTTTTHINMTNALHLTAKGLAEIYEVPAAKMPGYRAAVLKDPTEHAEVLTALAAQHPDETEQQIVDRYLEPRRNRTTNNALKIRCVNCQATTHTADTCPARG